MKADNPEEAIDEFLGVSALEEEKGEWLASRPVSGRRASDMALQGV